MHGIQQKNLFCVLVPRKKPWPFSHVIFFESKAPVMKKHPRNFEVKIPKNFEDYCCRKVANLYKWRREGNPHRIHVWYMYGIFISTCIYHGIYTKNVGKHKKHRFLYMGNGGSEHIFFSPLAPKEWLFFFGCEKNMGLRNFWGPWESPRSCRICMGGTFWLPKMISFDL